MSHHNYIPPTDPEASPFQGAIIAIACIAVFAFWGVLLALGV